jgi:Undecaprenyl-phosphate galactose phosphotransferase WbaP
MNIKTAFSKRRQATDGDGLSHITPLMRWQGMALPHNSISSLTLQTEDRAIARPLRAVATARPWLAGAVLALGDLAALSLAAGVSALVWRHIDARLSPEFYLHLWPVLLLFPLAYAASGLYPGFGRNPADELRKLSAATSMVYAALAVTVFLLKDAATYSRGVFLLAWAQTLILTPLFRGVARSVCSRKAWWGHPVVIVGAPHVAADIAATLERQPGLGLRPVAVFPVEIFDDPELAVTFARQAQVRHVILGMADTPRHVALSFINHCSDLFTNVIVVPDLAGFSSLWVEAHDLSGILGLEVHQRLLLPGSRIVKRTLDLVLVSVGGFVALPLVGAIAAMIKLTSPGPVFYGQRRYGRGGGPFIAWKFRSMVANASQVLEEHLNADPGLREEWQLTQKLKRDPRVTRLGRFLRHTSLDELPQLWNILIGEMSLVGPRPIIASEIARYGADFALYKKVRPGLTGMWQVSGRNLLSYEQRIGFDLYYVRNWSPWLDLHILARTVTTVLRGDGAY